MSSDSVAQIASRWRGPIRAIVVILALVVLVLYTLAIPARWDELVVPCQHPDCPVLGLTQSEMDALSSLGFTPKFYASYQTALEVISVTLFLLLAGVVFWRQSLTWIGIIVLVALLFFVFGGNVTSALARTSPDLTVVYRLLSSIISNVMFLLFFTFPNGRFVPSWTRPLALVGFVVAVGLEVTALLFSYIGEESTALQAMTFIVSLPLFLVGLYAQVHRYRFVSSRQERQQTKWVVAGLGCMLLTILLWMPTVELPLFPPGRIRLFWNLTGVVIIWAGVYVLPVSLGFSILRYRLWDIDILIRRTLQYALLTGLLALVYLGSVVLLQQLLDIFTGQESPLAIFASTLAIAALFNPLRRRVQDFIDRRLYRKKYDATQTLAAFAQTARQETDLDILSGRLIKWCRAPWSRRTWVFG